MKKLIIIICFILATSPQSYSQLLSENFEYDLLTNLADTPAWSPVILSGLLPIIVTIPGGLSFPSYAGSGLGNAVTLLPGLPVLGSEDDFASLSSTQNSGSVYSSFMLSMLTAQVGGDYFFSLRTTLGANNCRVYARPDGLLGFNLGIEKSNGAGVVYASPTYSILATYLVIVQYEFVAGAGNDQMSLWVFPVSSPPPASPPTPTLGPITFGSGTDASNLSTVLLRQGGETTGPTLIIDGIYVENSWSNSVLPVELASFVSETNKRDVTLRWSTSSEINNSAFQIERSADNTWSMIGSVSGNGTTNSVSEYSFKDRGLASGNYQYRLKQIDFNGSSKYYNLSNEVNIGIPSKYELSQNYPNPFNPSTSINFDIPFDGNVSIKLFDMSGKEVATIVNEIKTAGYHSVQFNASNLSTGTYFYSLTANNFTATKKMMLVK